MANALLPADEQTLTPDEVEALDKRRHKGQLLLVIGGQMFVFVALLSLWVGQDLTYSPVHPMSGLMALSGLIGIFCILKGLSLRRGNPEFF